MQILRGRTTGIDSLVISPDARYVAVSGATGCHVWDLHDPELTARALFESVGTPSRMQFTSATQLFARVARHWHRYDCAAQTESAPRLPGRVRTPNAIAHPTGPLLKGVDRLGAVETFRITAAGFESVGPAVPIGHSHLLIQFNPAGDRYLAYSISAGPRGDGPHLFDSATDTVLKSLVLPPPVYAGGESWHFSPDGLRVYAATLTRLLASDCNAGGLPVSERAIPGGGYYGVVAFHPDGRILATVENERAVTFRDAETLQVMRTYDFAMPKVTCVAFTPDGTRCVIGNSRGKVLLFDVE